jgi:twitching motility protein PilU
MQLEQLFKLMADKQASDLLLSAGSPVTIKIHGTMLAVNQAQVLSSDSIVQMLAAVLDESQLNTLLNDSDLNLGIRREEYGTFRLSAFKQKGNISAILRYIPKQIPTLESLNIPLFLGDIIEEPRGLILVCGSTGSGKSTTIAAMLERRNQRKTGHILSIEDPIEFYFQSRKSLINQREVGSDAPNMDIALKNALRQTPDVIFIGEIRDRQAMTAAITYALSGQLVVSTLHANNSYHALSRILSMYPTEARSMLLPDLSAALKSVITQRLVKSNHGGRVPVLEIMLNNQLTADLIEQGKLGELKDAMNNSLAEGSQTFEQHLMMYVNKGIISRDDALRAADSPTNLLWLLNNQGMTDSQANAKKATQANHNSAQIQEFKFS